MTSAFLGGFALGCLFSAGVAAVVGIATFALWAKLDGEVRQ